MKPPSSKFFVRWKGKISGPFERNTVREMLHRGEISLAHQIQVEDQWISIAEFLKPPKTPAVPCSDSLDASAPRITAFHCNQERLSNLPEKAPPSVFFDTGQHVPPFPWLRVATYALLVFVTYTLFYKDLVVPSENATVQQSTLDIWNEKNSIDERCASFVDELDRYRKLASAYSKLRLERADPVLASHLKASINLFNEGGRLTEAALSDAKKLELQMSEPDLRRRVLGALQKNQPTSSVSPGNSGKGIQNLDDGESLQTIIAVHQAALNEWRKEIGLQRLREKKLAIELSQKYSAKFRTAN
jgi:hypothetical protein